MPSTKSEILESDARTMVRLLGETAALDGGHAEKKRFLMRGLCNLIRADAWVWTLGCDIRPGGPTPASASSTRGFPTTASRNT